MKLGYKLLFGACVAANLIATSCVDDMKFGNSFLDKAPGGTATVDTVFSSAVYTQQFLNSIYGRQYYGLPYKDDTSLPVSSSPYCGKVEALTDCWQLHWRDAQLYSQYYSGIHTANYSRRQDKFCYNDEKVWEVVRWCWLLMEHIDDVPNLDANEKARMIAEAKCLIAVRYFDMFRHYGGLPLLYASFEGNESSYECPRATVEETVNYMIKMLDEAIDSGALPWAYGPGADGSSTYTGRWTKAGAMALKCKIWQFAASPLFNDAQGYAGGSSEAEQKHIVWYGGYRKELWNNCLKACEDFMNALRQNGFYELKQSVNNTPAGYRWAYRMAYIAQDSREILHSVRTNGYDAFKSATYMWHYWADLGRNSYTPTQEYIEMFPWADGKPFDWDKTKAEGKLDAMFMTGTPEKGWRHDYGKSDYFQLKGYLELLLRRFGADLNTMDYDAAPSDIFSEGLVYRLLGDGRTLAVMGTVAPALCRRFGIRQPVYAAEIQWDTLFTLVKRDRIQYRELPKFPEVRRDMALLLDEGVSYASLRKCAFRTGKKLLRHVNLFDVYRGDKIPEGKKQYALSFVFQDMEKTLTDNDVEKMMEKLLAAFGHEFGAALR